MDPSLHLKFSLHSATWGNFFRIGLWHLFCTTPTVSNADTYASSLAAIDILSVIVSLWLDEYSLLDRLEGLVLGCFFRLAEDELSLEFPWLRDIED